jgi:hypothetical protein
MQLHFFFLERLGGMRRREGTDRNWDRQKIYLSFLYCFFELYYESVFLKLT